jgi:hypothetical protein
MVNYENSIIYKIYGKNHDMVYYGSTTRKLYKRKSCHIYCFNHKKYETTASQIIKTNDYIFEIVEKYPCNNKKELHERERYYIENFKCINLLIPNRNLKQYYQDNKEKILKQNKKWTKDNYDKMREYKLKYYLKNKEKLKKKHNKKILCFCGTEILNQNKVRHRKTKKHANLLIKKI